MKMIFNLFVRRGRKACVFSVAALAFVSLSAAPSRADAVADFYKGRNIIMVVGSDPGGGYDIYARLLARHINRFIPGTPTIIVQNMPGAGSIKATNYVYNVAPQDGSVILAPNRTPPFAQILGQPGPQFDPKKIVWLGSLNNEVGVVNVWHTVPVKTLDEARQRPVIIGSTAPGTDFEVYTALLNNTIGTKFKVVRGYPGGQAIDLAAERGEIDGSTGDSFGSLLERYPDWRQKFTLLVQTSLTKHPALPDVPLIFEFLTADRLAPGMTLDDAKQLWEMMLIQKAMGRPYAVGPKVPEDRISALRSAFESMILDPAFLADATRGHNEILAVKGQDIQRMIAKVADSPREVIQKLNDAITYKGDAGKANGSEKN